MLVLSRKQDESIKLPGLGITIEVLKVYGQKVRLGVDAPVEIKVLRGELDNGSEPLELSRRVIIEGENQHTVRNKLNSLRLAIAIAEKHLERNCPTRAANVLDRTIRELESAKKKPEEKSQHDVNGSLGNSHIGNNGAQKFGVKALLVEDVANERTMLAGFLRLHGFNVDTVGDGMAAMEYLEDNQKPDVILMDMHMPRMDGPSTIRNIRNNPAFDGIKIFAVSGQSPENSGINVEENRISQWFQKPLEPRQLVEQILASTPSSCLN